jgi:hypothetical protein
MRVRAGRIISARATSTKGALSLSSTKMYDHTFAADKGVVAAVRGRRVGGGEARGIQVTPRVRAWGSVAVSFQEQRHRICL